MQIAGRVVPLGKGDYDSATTYNHLDWVRYDGCTWSCKQDNVSGVTPVEGDIWTLVSSKGSKGDTGASVEVAHAKDGKVTTITFSNAETHEELDSVEISDGEDGIGSGDMSKAIFATTEPTRGIVDKAIKLSDGTEEITISDVKSKITAPANATNGKFLKYNGSTWVAGDGATDWDSISDKPDFATVSTSGSYNDLSNKPTIPDAQVQTDWNATSGVSSIANKPDLKTVATSGSYNDLSDKPTIPDAQVQTDWNANSGISSIANKPNLSTVATSGKYDDLIDKPTLFSGSYNDLSDKPTIPTVNNATLTIKQGGDVKGTFTANSNNDVVVELSSGGSGGASSWTDLTGKPFNTVGSDFNTTSNELKLAKAIPTVTDTYSSTSTDAMSGKAVASAISNKANSSTSLSGYGITDAYTKTEIDTQIGDIETLLAAL